MLFFNVLKPFPPPFFCDVKDGTQGLPYVRQCNVSVTEPRCSPSLGNSRSFSPAEPHPNPAFVVGGISCCFIQPEHVMLDYDSV